MATDGATLRLKQAGVLRAGDAGDYILEITVGDRGVAAGGGFLIYPPITTVPHVWSMVRWRIGGCILRLPDNHDADAWMVLPDRFVYAESCAVLVRVVNGTRPMPPGYRFEVVLSDTQVQTFAMEKAWFALEADTEGRGHEAYAAPLESIPFVATTEGAARSNRSDAVMPSCRARNCSFDYEANRTGLCYVDVAPAQAARLAAVLEGKPQADGSVYLGIRAEDAYGNCTALDEEHLLISGSSAGIETPGRAAVPQDGPCRLRLSGCRVTAPGTYWVTVAAPQNGLSAVSSCTSTELSAPVFFGDLHGHTSLSDGLGGGAAYFEHARDVSFCDQVSLTDHNRFDDVIINLAEQFYEPGRFVTLFGRERGTAHGHRNVYSRSAEVVAGYEEADLWSAADKYGDEMLFVPHHTNAATKHHWFAADFEEYDPRHERLIEVVQNRGSFEREQVGGCVFDGGYGAAVQSALAQGRRFGFVGGSDTHRGQPGGPSHPLGPYFYRWRPFNGLTGAYMTELTRDGLWRALWQRRTYCTTGARILIDFAVNGAAMGSELPAAEGVTIKGFVAGTTTLASVEVICDNEVVHAVAGDGRRVVKFTWRDERVGGYYYLRVRQVDEHEAYASPVWIGPPQ